MSTMLVKDLDKNLALLTKGIEIRTTMRKIGYSNIEYGFNFLFVKYKNKKKTQILSVFGGEDLIPFLQIDVVGYLQDKKVIELKNKKVLEEEVPPSICILLWTLLISSATALISASLESFGLKDLSFNIWVVSMIEMGVGLALGIVIDWIYMYKNRIK